MERVQVNPAFPLFIDDANARARLGDIPATGQVLEDADEGLRRLLRACASEPRRLGDLQALLSQDHGVAPEDTAAAVDELLAARLLVRERDLDSYAADERLMRQALFFSMLQPADEVGRSLDALAACSVVVLGVGGIGSAVATQLVTAGVRKIRVVDDDCVELSNLHRQHLYTTADIGTAKVAAAARRVREYSPVTQVDARQQRLRGSGDVAEAIAGADFVVNTVDTPQPHIRRWVNTACVQAKVPFATAGFSQHMGVIGPIVVPGETACLACWELQDARRYGGTEIPTPVNIGRVIPAFGPLCAIIAGMLSAEIIGHVTTVLPPTITGRVLLVDLIELSVIRRDLARLDDCPACSQAATR